MSDAAASSVFVRCNCGAKLKVRADAAGKKFKCPRCGETVGVPADTYELSAPEPEPDLLAGIAAAADASKAAPPAAGPPGQKTIECPRCSARMPASAVLCVSCGYNTQTGRVEKGATAKKAAIRKLAVGAGSFALGCVFSGAAALAGALLWFLIVMGTEREIGWVAWGIGLGTGAAMYAGYRKKNVRAGLVAAGMAAIGVFVAKVATFTFILYAVFTGDTSSIELKRVFVGMRMANEMLDGRGIHDIEEREAKWPEVAAEAERIVKNMPKEEVERRWATYKEDDERNNAYADETGSKRAQLAQHRAERRVRKLGLTPYSDQQAAFYKEEFAEVRQWDETRLASEYEAHQKWQADGFWEDKEYVRDKLIYAIIDEQLAAERAAEGEMPGDEGAEDEYDDEEDLLYPEGEEWKVLHAEIAGDVDAMAFEEQVAEAKAIDRKNEVLMARTLIASHRAKHRSEREGLAFGDERRTAIYGEEGEAVKKLSDEEVLAESAKLKSWDDGGMWDDEAYVRDRLIYFFAAETMTQYRQAQGPNAPYDEAYPNDEQWERIYAEAVARAEAIPPGERVAAIKRLEGERDAKQRREFEEFEQQLTQGEAKEAIAGAVPVFFQSMFGALDLLFFGLAVVTAFQVASGGGSNE